MAANFAEISNPLSPGGCRSGVPIIAAAVVVAVGVVAGPPMWSLGGLQNER